MRAILGIVLLSVLFTFGGCKKDPPLAEGYTQVTGRVLLRGTNHAATTEKVVIKAYREYADPNAGLWGNIVELVAETTTDASGSYSIGFEANLDRQDQFFLRLESPLENHYNPANHKHYVYAGKKQEVNLFYTANAWLRLHFKNVNYQAGDRLRVGLGGGTVLEYFGPADQQHVHKVGGNTHFELPYAIRRNDVSTLIIDTIFAPAFDTTYHLIEY